MAEPFQTPQEVCNLDNKISSFSLTYLLARTGHIKPASYEEQLRHRCLCSIILNPKTIMTAWMTSIFTTTRDSFLNKKLPHA